MKTLYFTAALTVGLLLTACGLPSNEDHGHDETGAHAATEEVSQGEHGGRMLEQGRYAVELAIAEDGTPPKYRAWLYRDGKSLPPNAGEVEVRLTRLGNVAENHLLQPRGDGSLMAASIVGEPHSFDVEVLAVVDGQKLRWTYPSYEGRTVIAAEAAKRSGIEAEPVGPGVIADRHEVQGLLLPIEGRLAKVMARFPGPIRSLGANVGDMVRAGESLATIESNLSLTEYSVTAPIGGVVLARDASVGAIAGSGAPLFELADLSELWVDLYVFGADAGHIQTEMPVTVTRMSDGAIVQTTLERLLPRTATASQSTVARATIDNSDGLWRPGSAVRAEITVDLQQADLVVPVSALQTFRDWDVVFVRVGNTYEVRPVELGKRDRDQVAILAGLEKGDRIVVEQSYLVKADIEKSGASHDH